MRQSTAALVIAGVVATASAAIARQPDNSARATESNEAADDEASQRFQQGVMLYRERRYDAALAEFNRAYELAPNFRVLYNIGQVESELGDYVAAVKFFRQYLTDGGDAVGESRRAEVQAEINHLEGRIAQLRVLSNVDGAELLIDNEPAGVLPLASMPVNAGIRQVVVRKKGYETQELRPMLAGGEEKTVEVKLRVLGGASPSASSAKAKSTSEGAPHAGFRVRPNTGFWVSLAATTVAGGATAVFALLTWNADKRLDDELNRFPGSSRIDDARHELKGYALLTDGCGALAVVGLGATVYFAFTGGVKTSMGSRQGKVTLQTGPVGAGQQGVGWNVSGQF